MPPLSWNFESFLSKVKDLAWHEIVKQAQAECRRAQKAARGHGGLKNREDGCVQYAASLKTFLWFMRNGGRPAGPVPEFPLYLPVIAALVEKGQMKPSALDEFRGTVRASRTAHSAVH